MEAERVNVRTGGEREEGDETQGMRDEREPQRNGETLENAIFCLV